MVGPINRLKRQVVGLEKVQISMEDCQTIGEWMG